MSTLSPGTDRHLPLTDPSDNSARPSKELPKEDEEMARLLRDAVLEKPEAVMFLRRQAAETIERLMIERDERAKWAEAWHRALETVATVLEVPSTGSDKMLLRDINEAINKLRSTAETPVLPESLRDPTVVMESVRTLHQQTDTALWLLRHLNRLGGLGHDKHRLIDAVLEGRAYIRGDSLYTDGPPHLKAGEQS